MTNLVSYSGVEAGSVDLLLSKQTVVPSESNFLKYNILFISIKTAAFLGMSPGPVWSRPRRSFSGVGDLF